MWCWDWLFLLIFTKINSLELCRYDQIGKILNKLYRFHERDIYIEYYSFFSQLQKGRPKAETAHFRHPHTTYVCQVCGTKITTSQTGREFEYHMNEHEGVRPFKVITTPVKDVHFEQNYLKKTSRRHSGERELSFGYF